MTFFFEHEADDVDGILLGYENLRHVKCSVTPGPQKIPEPKIFRVFKGNLDFCMYYLWSYITTSLYLNTVNDLRSLLAGHFHIIKRGPRKLHERLGRLRHALKIQGCSIRLRKSAINVKLDNRIQSVQNIFQIDENMGMLVMS